MGRPRVGARRKGTRPISKRQIAGLNKSVLDVGMSALNKMMIHKLRLNSYKIEAKGGLLLILDTKKLKPSQRCPNCGKIHKHWADLSNRYHVCDSCGFEIERDKGSTLVMYQTALSRQPGDGIALVDVDVRSSTSKTRKDTGSFRQLQQKKRSKPSKSVKVDGEDRNPIRLAVG